MIGKYERLCELISYLVVNLDHVNDFNIKVV